MQTPELQNLVLLPLTTGGHDATLEQLTGGRIPCLPPDSIPNYLRTKLDPEIEKYEQEIDAEVANLVQTSQINAKLNT